MTGADVLALLLGTGLGGGAFGWGMWLGYRLWGASGDAPAAGFKDTDPDSNG